MGLPGGWELVIIALVALLIFGGAAGARLAGLGKGAGRAIREFKEETRGTGSTDKGAVEPGRDSTSASDGESGPSDKPAS